MKEQIEALWFAVTVLSLACCFLIIAAAIAYAKIRRIMYVGPHYHDGVTPCWRES